MEKNDKELLKSPQLAQLAVGFLLGSGGAGAAMALVGKEGFQIFGLVTFVFCVLLAVVIVLVFHKDDKERELRAHEMLRRQQDLDREEQRRRDNAQVLADFYNECFRNIGTNLALRLQSHSTELKASVFRVLISDLNTQEENIAWRRTASQELVSTFQTSIKAIRDKWQSLSEEDLPIVEGPPDASATPQRVEGEKALAHQSGGAPPAS